MQSSFDVIQALHALATIGSSFQLFIPKIRGRQVKIVKVKTLTFDADCLHLLRRICTASQSQLTQILSSQGRGLYITAGLCLLRFVQCRCPEQEEISQLAQALLSCVNAQKEIDENYLKDHLSRPSPFPYAVRTNMNHLSLHKVISSLLPQSSAIPRELKEFLGADFLTVIPQIESICRRLTPTAEYSHHLIQFVAACRVERAKNIARLIGGRSVLADVEDGIFPGELLSLAATIEDSSYPSTFIKLLQERALCLNVQIYSDMLPLAYLSPHATLPTKAARYVGNLHTLRHELENYPLHVRPFILQGFSERFTGIGVWQKINWDILEEVPLADGNRIFLKGNLEVQFAIPGKEICRVTNLLDLSFLEYLTFEDCRDIFDWIESACNSASLDEYSVELLVAIQTKRFLQAHLLKNVIVNFVKNSELLVTLCLLAVGDRSVNSPLVERITL